ncbi:hypothetical protein NS226_13350 [Aureimonas ureilytica]|uniref:Lipoprotein n=2 Tax=Aureimonas ureilytica TaxID=401562 RepID=A0A175R7H4_9HYPH|nr:hypothetical protein NS226_13350 [Aureimonas ureilytica]
MTPRLSVCVLGLALGLTSGCQSVAAPSSSQDASSMEAPNALERQYLGETGHAVYRGRSFQRTRNFLFGDPSRGYAICLRSAKRGGGFDHTLLVLQRRISGAVSQVEDDVQILRAAADVGACRTRSDWVDAR